MIDNINNINQLMIKLENLLIKQDSFSKEINELRQEIKLLKSTYIMEQVENVKSNLEVIDFNNEVKKTMLTPFQQYEQVKTFKNQDQYSDTKSINPPKIKSDIEKFIGENLINKIGIIITVIGVAIGAKYSIEHQLISPLTRIILGYLMGLILLGFGIKLKKKYENYSSVLVSGGIAILYFLTFFAYSFYALMPQVIAFILMVFFTAFTIIAAINYNKQIIALIGLVGAYAVPFLLSDGSGKVAVLFSYMAIINIGILLIAFKKYWKLLYYSSFFLTWLIFIMWYTTKFQITIHFGLSLIFLFVFFTIFYLIFLAYKLLQKEKFKSADILLLLANIFIFYGIGYSILNNHKTGEQLLGLFTLGNAIIHFGVSVIIYKQKLADKNLFFLLVGLVLVFITITIPVQLEGNWVTLLWVFESALLFWIGRTKNVSVFEKLSYPLMFLAFFSIAHDFITDLSFYMQAYRGTGFVPIFNIYFLSSILFITSFSFINYLNNNKKYTSNLFQQKALNSIITFSIPAILLFVIYYSLHLEITYYWEQLYDDSSIMIENVGQSHPDYYFNHDIQRFQKIWIINYSLLFFSILSFVNIKKIKNRKLGLITLCINAFLIFEFLSNRLNILKDLRESYLNQILSKYYHRGIFNIGIRYISFILVGLLLYTMYKYLKNDFLKPISEKIKLAYDLLLHISVLWIASNELINWMEILKFSQSYELGLSILWGLYALFLIFLGIWKKKKHLRIFSFALFTITLIKLFFYDISHLDTIAKTIVFVSLGILLLLISFLYNKFKHKIN